jgi:hypothetical protein
MYSFLIYIISNINTFMHRIGAAQHISPVQGAHGHRVTFIRMQLENVKMQILADFATVQIYTGDLRQHAILSAGIRLGAICFFLIEE